MMFLTGLKLFAASLCLFGRADAQAHYNEQFARLTFYLTAGAYSNTPEACINETARVAGQPMQIHSSIISECDADKNKCSYYTVISPVAKQIFIVFRGTKGKKQLLHETLQSLQHNVDFYGYGKVNRYFFRALNSMWESVSPILSDSQYKDFSVVFTGHSLGGALASLASMRTALEGLRTPSQVLLYTFGQPRVGNHKFAIEHDRLVPMSYRVVNRNDVVPHLPLCQLTDSNTHRGDNPTTNRNTSRLTQAEDSNNSDNDDDGKDFNLGDAIKNPCDQADSKKAYHHATEIWYPDGMADSTFHYRECLGEPKNEDHNCSNGVHFDAGWTVWRRYFDDHLHYFGEKVSEFGKRGCKLTEVIPKPTFEGGTGSERQAGETDKIQMVVNSFLEKLNNFANG